MYLLLVLFYFSLQPSKLRLNESCKENIIIVSQSNWELSRNQQKDSLIYCLNPKTNVLKLKKYFKYDSLNNKFYNNKKLISKSISNIMKSEIDKYFVNLFKETGSVCISVNNDQYTFDLKKYYDCLKQDEVWNLSGGYKISVYININEFNYLYEFNSYDSRKYNDFYAYLLMYKLFNGKIPNSFYKSEFFEANTLEILYENYLNLCSLD